MKQKNGPHLDPLLPQDNAGQAPGEEERITFLTLTNSILQKLSTIEDLLKRKDTKPLTFKEACAYLGYAPSYLYKLTYKNVIPHYKPTGKVIFFSKNEIDEWIFTNRCQNSAVSNQNKNEDPSAELCSADPNQVDLFEKDEDDSSTPSENEIVIEFPLKSRRKK